MSSCVTFRHAEFSDADAIIGFLNEYWGSQHPLVNRPEFFSFYYQASGKLQFVLAEENGEMLAVAGYILSNQCAVPDAWVSIWLAKKGKNGVGLELMEALPRLANIRVLACNNIRPKTMAFYRFLGWHADRIPHFYRLAKRDSYRLVQNAPSVSEQVFDSNVTLQHVDSDEKLFALGLPRTENLPHKDLWYIARRYFHFPHQSYDVWAVMDGETLLAYLVTRTNPVAECDATMLRIVDFIGQSDTFAALGGVIGQLMQQCDAEVTDCYCAGIDKEIFSHAGFLERCEEDAVVVPNYLNPPLFENIEYYYFTNYPENFVLFKADGDQDRPNL